MKPHARPMADYQRDQDRREALDTVGTMLAVLFLIVALALLAAGVRRSERMPLHGRNDRNRHRR